MAVVRDTGAVYALYDADASVVATAERLGVQRIFTFDERHFRAIVPATFGHFVLLPADRDSE